MTAPAPPGLAPYQQHATASILARYLPRRLARLAPPVNFITLHYAYFITVSLAASALIWLLADPELEGGMTYIDSLFLAVSAVTNTGLNTVDLSELRGAQQGILWVLMCLGSALWVSYWMSLFKKGFSWRGDRWGKAGEDDYMLSDLGRRGRRRRTGRSSAGAGDMPLLRGKEKIDGDEDGEGLVRAIGSGLSLSDASSGGVMATHSHYQHHQTGSHGSASTIPSIGEHPAFEDTLEHFPTHSTAYESDSGATTGPRSWAHWLYPFSKGSRGGKAISRPGTPHHNHHHNYIEHPVATERRAFQLLAFMIPLYALLWLAVSAAILGSWIAAHYPQAARDHALSPWWIALFYAGSAFNNCGMSLIDTNLVPFQFSYVVLGTIAALLLAGNTAFPAFLRLMVWTTREAMRWLAPRGMLEGERRALGYVLRTPKRVYTHLFPGRQTWWLVAMLMGTICVDWVAFEVMSIGNAVVEAIPIGHRILNGLFQSISVRGSGFYVVPVTSLFFGLQVLYMFMMYISAFPVVIAMRHANVYEERSLGTPLLKLGEARSSDEDDEDDDPERGLFLSGARSRAASRKRGALHTVRRLLSYLSIRNPKPTSSSLLSGRAAAPRRTKTSLLGQQIRAQLLHDLWWLPLMVLVITILETYFSAAYATAQHVGVEPDDEVQVVFSVFHIAFEVVSAYGCVGMSVGLPHKNYSLAGGWTAGGKLCLILVMLRGRHRGLEVLLDRVAEVKGKGRKRDDDEE